jgi:hypothetical protein
MYSSVDDLKPLLDQGKTVIVPNTKQAQKNPKENRLIKMLLPTTLRPTPLLVLRERSYIDTAKSLKKINLSTRFEKARPVKLANILEPVQAQNKAEEFTGSSINFNL